MSLQTHAIEPLMRWSGGKTKLLKSYQGLLPKYDDVHSYVEPFFGAGALFCDMVSKSPKSREYLINDSNRELAAFYTALRDSPIELIDWLASIERKYLRLSVDDKKARKEFYYACRNNYWHMQPGTVGAAATLYFMLKTSFNGIWQTCKASNGLFATPVGLAKETKVFDEAKLLAWSKVLKTVVLSNCSFEQVRVTPGSFVYCDPPYRGGFTKYGSSFTDDDQIRLIEWCDSLARQGCSVLLANRDLGDGFFKRHLPRYCVVSRIDVTYTAGRRKRTKEGFEAKPATEFLIDFAIQRGKLSHATTFMPRSHRHPPCREPNTRMIR